MHARVQKAPCFRTAGSMILLLCTPSVLLSAESSEGLLEMSLEQLMEVEVEPTALLTRTTKRLTPATVTTITQEQIWSSAARDLTVRVDGYNLLGMLNKDINKRPFIQGLDVGAYRSEAPALVVSLQYKF
jgi:hypothetical protein